ncbi:hypothetical protein KEM55_000936 [Ascosphaera atra]|nr:hypothetical protein KEM55_000936 [Ascosphaera atra]
MTIKSTYESFLNEPSRSSIADEAALNYITTATQIVGAENIHEHLAQLQETTVKKNEQKILNVVEGYCSLSLEVQTALEFIGGGGPYVPDAEELDSIKGKTATLTIIHIVHFDKSDKIAQIRLIWDQAALLKQLSVIPSDSTLPIKDLSEQTQLVSQSASEAAKVAPEKPTPKKVTVKKSTVSSPSAPRTTRTTASRPALLPVPEISISVPAYSFFPGSPGYS